MFPRYSPLSLPPAPLTAYDPTSALPDFADRVARLRSCLLDAKQKPGAKGRAETPVEQAFSYLSEMGASCRWGW